MDLHVRAGSIKSYEINGEVQINLLVRGNPNGNSCFPVRRTGTLLVYIYKRECLCVCGAKCLGTSRWPRKFKFCMVIGFATKPKEKLRKPEISVQGRNQGPLKVSP